MVDEAYFFMRLAPGQQLTFFRLASRCGAMVEARTAVVVVLLPTRLRASAAHTAVGTQSRSAPRDSLMPQQALLATHCFFMCSGPFIPFKEYTVKLYLVAVTMA